MSQLATLRHADEPQDCLLIGVDRKGPAHGQSDAIDPKETCELLTTAVQTNH